MRVIVDIVVNHTSTAHPWFRDMKRHGKSSPYWSYYDRGPNGQVTHYFDWKHPPNLNFAEPAVRREVTATFLHWVREYGVDGFRVDVAWGIRGRAPAYWPELRRSLDDVRPGTVLLAEASARYGWYRKHGFDASYDWRVGSASGRGAMSSPVARASTGGSRPCCAGRHATRQPATSSGSWTTTTPDSVW